MHLSRCSQSCLDVFPLPRPQTSLQLSHRLAQSPQVGVGGKGNAVFSVFKQPVGDHRPQEVYQPRTPHHHRHRHAQRHHSPAPHQAACLISSAIAPGIRLRRCVWQPKTFTKAICWAWVALARCTVASPPRGSMLPSRCLPPMGCRY